MNDLANQYDVAIIGAGVAGLAAAYYLARNNCHVVVIEQETQPAYHSSGRSAAVFIEGYENPIVSGLTSASREFFFKPPAGFSDVPLVHPRGGLTIAANGESQQLKAYLSQWQPYCPKLTDLSTADALSMVPILNSDRLCGAAYDPAWHSIDIHALIQGYQQGLRQHDGKVLTNTSLVDLSPDAQGWQLTLAETSPRSQEDMMINANIVINASGAWANATAALADLAPIDLTPLRRTAVIIPPPSGTAVTSWPVVHTVSGNLYFKPESSGLMVCPQDETPSTPTDAQAEELDIAIAMHNYGEVTTHDTSNILSAWAGLRTFTTDRYPVIGFDPRAHGFFWLAGQGGFGVQTSPALGCLAAEVVSNSATSQPPDTMQAIDMQRLLSRN